MTERRRRLGCRRYGHRLVGTGRAGPNRVDLRCSIGFEDRPGTWGVGSVVQRQSSLEGKRGTSPHRHESSRESAWLLIRHQLMAVSSHFTRAAAARSTSTSMPAAQEVFYPKAPAGSCAGTAHHDFRAASPPKLADRAAIVWPFGCSAIRREATDYPWRLRYLQGSCRRK